MKILRMVWVNVRRNLLRSILTGMGTSVLVFVITLVWSILSFLDQATSEKNDNFKIIVTERWQIPSQMPFAYADSLSEGAAREPGDIRPMDSMTWQFYVGLLDLENRTRENMMVSFAMEPRKLLTMMDELDSLPEDQRREFEKVVNKLQDKRQGIILGRDRLASINKKVGERIKVFGLNYKEIDLELEIVGLFPPGRYDPMAAINRDYLNAALDAYPGTHAGKPHPMAQKSLNLVWLRVPDRASFEKIAGQVMKSPLYSQPAVKCETAASGISTFMDSYRDLLWGMRYLLSPAVLITLSLVIANAISISVRERRMEFAILKVLGFQPYHLLLMVMTEALLLGAGAGALSSWATYGVINNYIGGIKFPIAFFGAFLIPTAALWWGPAIGAVAAFAGSFLPAWSARTVKVADVFAKVA
ncbi:MAG: ABC transporter permease [Planctomycetaceae bacterium]